MAPMARLVDDLPAPSWTAAALPTPSDGVPPLTLRMREDRWLPRSAVAGVLDSDRGVLDVCYAAATHVNPGLPGTGEIRFTIGDNGHVKDVDTQMDGLRDSSATSCIRHVVSKLTFAAPGVPVDVRVHLGRALEPTGPARPTHAHMTS